MCRLRLPCAMPTAAHLCVQVKKDQEMRDKMAALEATLAAKAATDLKEQAARSVAALMVDCHQPLV